MSRAERRAFERELKRAVKKAGRTNGGRGISTIRCRDCNYYIPRGGTECLCTDKTWEWSEDGKSARFVVEGTPSEWMRDGRLF